MGYSVPNVALKAVNNTFEIEILQSLKHNYVVTYKLSFQTINRNEKETLNSINLNSLFV